jgi:hypothetical protein
LRVAKGLLLVAGNWVVPLYPVNPSVQSKFMGNKKSILQGVVAKE